MVRDDSKKVIAAIQSRRDASRDLNRDWKHVDREMWSYVGKANRPVDKFKSFMRILRRMIMTPFKKSRRPLLKALSELSAAEKEIFINERRILVDQARERTKGVPLEEIEAEIEEAVHEVRSGRASRRGWPIKHARVIGSAHKRDIYEDVD